ncbi:MAG: hypothetical protein KY392_05760 [Chloroflexi bacterium]|nr:hypothetical protein [Chloroflexota bacterium]
MIRPAALYPGARRRQLLLAVTMLAAGFLAAQLALMSPVAAVSGTMAGAAAIGLGVGVAWLVRAVRPTRARRLTERLAAILGRTFDDAYTLVLAPRLPIRDAAQLDGILIGPGGVRVLTIRDWEGRYRVRGRVWEFDARGRRGWIRCRTNPSFDAVGLASGVARWAVERGIGELPIRPVIAFPDASAHVVLEEPADEIVTGANAPWWANSIGRVRRLDPADGARLLEAILDAAEHAATNSPRRRVTETA